MLAVSRVRRWIKPVINQLLVKAGEVYRGIKLLLSDWEDGMEKPRISIRVCMKKWCRVTVAELTA